MCLWLSSRQYDAPVRQTVVLLHGFGGTHRSWDAVAARLDPQRYRPLALDLPGHGRRAALRPITFASCVEHVLAQAPRRFVLCGYSMGGRIALHTALAAPGRVTRLVLVSASAGICAQAERGQRRRADARLAAELENGSFERFIERWNEQPLFAGDPPGVAALARAEQLRNDPRALARVLRGVGAGEMQPLWPRLAELAMPTTLVVGQRDLRYRELAAAMRERIAGCELDVVGGGHRLALENPAALAEVLQRVDS
jgi:2-succinyl-6-hydroxy-2,4-cyclohexadiene-1-carboxylate synthase